MIPETRFRIANGKQASPRAATPAFPPNVPRLPDNAGPAGIGQWSGRRRPRLKLAVPKSRA